MASELSCPNGHSNPQSAKFCRSCGLPLHPATENATDVSDTSEVGRPQAASPPTEVVMAQGAGSGIPAGPNPTVPPGTPVMWTQPPPPRKTWPIVVIVALALVVVGLGAAFAATELSHSTPAASNDPKTSTTSVSSSTASTATSLATSTTVAATSQEAQALSALLSNSAVDRSEIVSAVQQITSCGDLVEAQGTLDQAAASRQSLLNQLGQMQLGSLPNSSELSQALQSAWQASLASDNAYAAYAGDEISNFNGCTPNDSGDSNAQAAATADSQATAAKTTFVNLWNPIAATYGLPQWQATSL